MLEIFTSLEFAEALTVTVIAPQTLPVETLVLLCPHAWVTASRMWMPRLVFAASPAGAWRPRGGAQR